MNRRTVVALLAVAAFAGSGAPQTVKGGSETDKRPVESYDGGVVVKSAARGLKSPWWGLPNTTAL